MEQDDRQDSYPALGIGPRRGRGGGEARALAARGALRGFVGTVSEAVDLIGQYQDAGVDLLTNSDRWNAVETRELSVSDVMPHFTR
jgi:hypothetical protein